MRKLFTIAAVLALATAPAIAGGNHGNGGNPCGGNCGNGNGGSPTAPEGLSAVGGAFGGVAHSHSSGGSFAASGGIAANGADGRSFVRNEQSAGQLSGAFSSFDGAVRDNGAEGTLVTETFTDGFSQSRTVTRNAGSGTLGAGAGFATNWGSADAAGAFGGGAIGTRNW